MSVYVDLAKHSFGRMTMCHMMADTAGELHSMADKIGIARKWYQPQSSPHYDICKSKRVLAVEKGAIEIDNIQVVRLIRKIRQEGWT